MRNIITFLLLPFLFSFAPSEPTSVYSSLTTVTVYRTGAEMIHKATVGLRAGENELVINGLSSYIDINSIQVNCPSTVTILGIEFNNNFLGEENISPAVQKLMDSLESINDDIQHNNILISGTKELLEVLKANREIKGSQTGMSVTELTKLMTYYKTKTIELQNELIGYNAKKTKLDVQAAKVSKQIQEEQKKNTRSGGRLILQLSVAIPVNADFTISYITQNAYWTPYYDIKADNIQGPLKFIYKAKIAQTTGIDWKKVKLSLSTSSPKQYGNAPVFKTWFLGYIDPVRLLNRELSKSNTINSMLDGKVAGLQLKESVVTSAYGIMRSQSAPGYGSAPLYIVNGTIIRDASNIDTDKIKEVNILKGEDATSIYGAQGAGGVVLITLKDGLEDYITISDSELDISYDIDLPYDVPTNGKQQIATLKEISVPATYKYYSVPKLDKDAFLLAEVPNWQKLNLLSGEANIIFEGTYIGKSFIDPANTSDTLNLTLGTDKRVVIKKEKMIDYSSVKFLGSNKLQTLTYDLTIKNNKKEPVRIIIKDQFPISTNKDIEVELLQSSNGIVNSEIGVVTWILTIEPGQHKKQRISYSVKYPKGKQVGLGG
ncbi:MAG TPA: DUF4139 domain-containing protein [Ferruginibacter sp.]|nr:DUF4139 domain-containing protein [Ferruginibacter sp.]